MDVAALGVAAPSKAQKRAYDDQLMAWLESHGCRIKDKVAFDQACKVHFHDIMRTLRNDQNPEAVLSYLLDSTEVITGDTATPRSLGRRAAVLVQKELQRCDPCEQTLSAALLLAQRKRRDLIARLESGENLVEDEREVFTLIHTPSDGMFQQPDPGPPKKKKTLPGSAQPHQGSPLRETHFQPRWEHFNTMRTRWKYIQPQVRNCAEEQAIVAPSTSTTHIRVGNTQLSGSFVDYKTFQHTVHARQSKTLSFAAKSMLLVRQEEQRQQDRVYVPKPFVRHPK